MKFSKREVLITASLLLLPSRLGIGKFIDEKPIVESIKTKKLNEPVKILLYHRVEENKSGRLIVLEKELKKQIYYLTKNNYKTIFLHEIDNENKNKIVITFDDVNSNFYKLVFPMLKKYKIKVMISPVVDYIGMKGFLSWDQLIEMERSGLVDIQSHTMSHSYLTRIPFRKAVKEMKRSKKILEERLGKKINCLSWPYGTYNNRLISAAKKAGYKYFLTCKDGKNTELCDELRRVVVDGNLKINDFAQVINK